MTKLLVALFGASWRTTLLGFAEAIGMAVVTYLAAGIPDLSTTQRQQIFVGGLMTAVVTAIRGYFTKDKNVSNSPTPLAVAQPVVPITTPAATAPVPVPMAQPVVVAAPPQPEPPHLVE